MPVRANAPPGRLIGAGHSGPVDAAPARCASQAHVREAGVTVRRYYERLPRDGWTRTGRRRRNPPDDAGVWPVACPGSTVPSPKIAASGAPQGDAVRLPPRTVEAKRDNYSGCASRRAMPLIFRGGFSHTSRLRPARTRAHDWLRSGWFRSGCVRRGCLKSGSGKTMPPRGRRSGIVVAIAFSSEAETGSRKENASVHADFSGGCSTAPAPCRSGARWSCHRPVASPRSGSCTRGPAARSANSNCRHPPDWRSWRRRRKS